MSCLAAEAELFHLSFGDLDASLIVCSIQDGLHFQTGLGLGCTEHRRNKRGVTGMRSFFRGAEALSTGVGREEMASQCDLLCKPAEVEQMIQDASSEFRAGGGF